MVDWDHTRGGQGSRGATYICKYLCMFLGCALVLCMQYMACAHRRMSILCYLALPEIFINTCYVQYKPSSWWPLIMKIFGHVPSETSGRDLETFYNMLMIDWDMESV